MHFTIIKRSPTPKGIINTNFSVDTRHIIKCNAIVTTIKEE